MQMNANSYCDYLRVIAQAGIPVINMGLPHREIQRRADPSIAGLRFQ